MLFQAVRYPALSLMLIYPLQTEKAAPAVPEHAKVLYEKANGGV
jgi:hypothetical protein